MKSVRTPIITIVNILMMTAMSIATQVSAQDSASLIKEINKGFRESQQAMFKGDYKQAAEQMESVREQLDQLKSIDPDNNQLSAFENKYSKSLTEINRRLSKDKHSTPASAASAAAKAKEASGDTLPASAKRSLCEIDTAIDKAQRVLDSTGPSSADYRVKQARFEMQSANTAWNDLNAKYPDTAGHSESVAAKERMYAMYARIDEFESGAQQEAQAGAQADAARQGDSESWIEKFNVYTQSSSDKYFISGYTEDAQDMDRRMQLFAELSALFGEYENASFPEGKTEELERMEKDIRYNLDIFRNELTSAAERYVVDAGTELDRGFAFCQQNEERTKDGTTKPLLLHDDVLDSIAKKIDWIKNLLPGDSRIAPLESRFEDLKKQQSVWREKMIESTVMLPDAFNGDEADAIKGKAADIVSAKYPAALLLRTNITSPDWKEERVIEFTDTTRTAVQHRVTRSVTVQVAAQSEDTFLYTLYVAKDQRSDGSWGMLYGHIMFTDRMLEENVNK